MCVSVCVCERERERERVSWERRAGLLLHDTSAGEECLQAGVGCGPSQGGGNSTETLEFLCVFVCSGGGGAHTLTPLCFCFRCLGRTQRRDL